MGTTDQDVPSPVSSVSSRRRILALATGGTALAAGVARAGALSLPGAGHAVPRRTVGTGQPVRPKAATGSAIGVPAARPQARGSVGPTPVAAAGGWSSDPTVTPRGLTAHLLRRAWFGFTESDLQAASLVPYPALVDLITSEQTSATGPSALADRIDLDKVTGWWWEQMASSKAQFPDRMALFWHGILTSNRAFGGINSVWQQLDVLRRHGTGDLRTLLNEITVDAMMMKYLDLSGSTAKAPNENYARELMELFTLGPGHYTETDVREGARALSGYVVTMYDASGHVMHYPKGMTPKQGEAWMKAQAAQGAYWRGALEPRLHDAGTKTFLGRTGNLAAPEVIDAILAQPACAEFIATKALSAFGVPAPSAPAVTAVATAFRTSNYDIRTLMRAVFLSPDFMAGAYRSLVRSPIEFAVAGMRAVGHPEFATRLGSRAYMEPMGQEVFAPPNVAGWPGGAAWISSGPMLARVNFAGYLVTMSGRSLPDAAGAVATQLDGVVSEATAAALAGCTTEADRWYVLLSSPEFNLK